MSRYAVGILFFIGLTCPVSAQTATNPDGSITVFVMNPKYLVNASTGSTQFGPVLISRDPNGAPSRAVYHVEMPRAAKYKLSIKYAAQLARPIRVTLNDTPVKEDALLQPTGCWEMQCQKWETIGEITLKEGQNTLALDRDSHFPHISAIQLELIRPTETAPGSITTLPAPVPQRDGVQTDRPMYNSKMEKERRVVQDYDAPQTGYQAGITSGPENPAISRDGKTFSIFGLYPRLTTEQAEGVVAKNFLPEKYNVRKSTRIEACEGKYFVGLTSPILDKVTLSLSTDRITEIVEYEVGSRFENGLITQIVRRRDWRNSDVAPLAANWVADLKERYGVPNQTINNGDGQYPSRVWYRDREGKLQTLTIEFDYWPDAPNKLRTFSATLVLSQQEIDRLRNGGGHLCPAVSVLDKQKQAEIDAGTGRPKF